MSGVRDLLHASAGEDAGIIVPSGDAGALADALGTLIDDETLSFKLGSSARAVAETFSLEHVGARLADVLRGVEWR